MEMFTLKYFFEEELNTLKYFSSSTSRSTSKYFLVIFLLRLFINFIMFKFWEMA